MKRKILFTVILSLVMLGTLSACGKDKKEPSAVNEVVEQNAVENIEDKEPITDEKVNEDKSSDESTQIKRDSMEMYQAFLDGTEPLFFDQRSVDGKLVDDKYTDLFEAGTPYVMDEILDALVGLKSEYDEDFSIGGVKYAYIDCGLDGEKELALMIEEVSGYTNFVEFIEVFIIKAIDDKLQLCYEEEAGYRSYITVKNNGCITASGASGAYIYYNDHKMVDKDGHYEYVYGVYTSYMLQDLLLDCDNINWEEIEDLLYSTSYEQYSFRDYKYGDDYEKYKQDAIYVYYGLDEYSEPILEDDSIYEPDSRYAKLFANTSFTFATPKEIEKITSDRIKELGLTQEMIDEAEVSWTVLWEREEISLEEDEETVPVYTVENPSWEYVIKSDAKASDKKLKLTKLSQKSNDITDDYVWFDEIGILQPDRNDFSDQSFEYLLTGDEEYYPYMIDVIDLGDYKTKARLDFSNHRYADNALPEDLYFVDEAVKWAVSDGFTLYVSIAHNTYASSASHNAYVMALDMQNDYKVLWKSQPLVANSVNFEVIDDFIVCGYGFTAEDDYLYILDRYTGQELERIPLKSKAYYIFEIDDKLYVRTYNTDYVFDIEIEE